jgi:predicted RNA binding protein YcfA (HicA-like mRNA interferase family)
MGRQRKLLQRVLLGDSDRNIAFDELRALLSWLGFEERIRGSHHLYRKPGIRDMINLQRQGSQAKPYQVRQVRTVLLEYRLGGQDDAEV